MIIGLEYSFINTDMIAKVEVENLSMPATKKVTVRFNNGNADCSYTGNDATVIEKIYRHLALVHLDEFVAEQGRLLRKIEKQKSHKV